MIYNTIISITCLIFPTLLDLQVMMKKKMVENESSGDVKAAFKVFDQDGDG